MTAEPLKEHLWLQKLLGEWNYEHEACMSPHDSPEKFVGEESVRSIGGLWVMCEGRGNMPGGGAATTIMTIGYDPAKSCFVGSFIGSMMYFLWIYDNGKLDAAGKVLTLDSEGPSFANDGTMAKYQDSIEFLSDDHRTLSSKTLGADGKWNHFMTAHYRRKK